MRYSTAIDIVDQIGGVGFLRATETTIYTRSANAVALKLTNTDTGANRLTIWRNVEGTYDVRLFVAIGNREPDIKGSATDVAPIKLLQAVNDLTGFDYYPSLRS